MRIIGGVRLVGNAIATRIFALQEMLYLGTLRRTVEPYIIALGGWATAPWGALTGLRCGFEENRVDRLAQSY